MTLRCNSLLISLLSLLLLHSADVNGNSCGITNSFSYPFTVTTVSSFVEIHCDYNDDLDFNSFYTPSGETLTSSNEPKYVINNSGNSAILIIKNIEESDAGQYSCNFRDQNNQECQEDIELELTPIAQFCTPNFVTYHAYIGENATLKCCVENYNTWTWSAEGQEVDESDRFSFDGTDLQIYPVELGDQGMYTCTAEMNGIPVTIKAQLEVYLQLSVTMNPAQLVVNASEMAVLTCVAQAYPLPSILWSREASLLELVDGVVEKEVEIINTTTIRSTLTVFNVQDVDTGTYRCTAANVNISHDATASLQLFGTPSAPQRVNLTIVDNTSILVSWDVPADDGHLPLLEYNVMWVKVNLSTSASETLYMSGTVNGSTRHYIITNLRPVTNYTVKVYAKNERGKGKTSDDRSISTLHSFPDPLFNLQTQQLTAYSVHIEYTISPNAGGGSPITTLRIIYQAGNDTQMVKEVPIAVPQHTHVMYTSSYELEDLKGDTPYLIRVSVGNAIGLFGPETKRTFRTLHPTHPPTPTSVTISEIEATSVDLTWNVADVGRPYIEYRIHAIEPRTGPVSGGTLYTFKPTDISRNGMEERVKIPDLKPTTCYMFTVTITNKEGAGTASVPSNETCTPSCRGSSCRIGAVSENTANDPSTAQLLPVLLVTIVVAVLVIMAVVVVATLSWRHSKRKSDLTSSSLQNFTTSSLSSSHFSTSTDNAPSHSGSSLGYHYQTSLTSTSITDPDEAPPTTGSSIVSDGPFNLGLLPNQNGTSQYQNRLYQNPTTSVASYINMASQPDCPQSAGVKSTVSYPLFPIPENRAVLGHFEASVPILPNRPRRDATMMTDNPAFDQRQSPPVPDELNTNPNATPPPIPPYRGDSFSNTESNQPPPQIHIHSHIQNQNSQPPLPPRSHSTQSVPFLGESFSQASRSPHMPRLDFALPDRGTNDEEDEIEFMENNAYESVTPTPQRREFLSQDDPLTLEGPKLMTPHNPRGRSASPVLPRRNSTQSSGSGSVPIFQIAGEQKRGLVFETVQLKSRV